MMVQRGPSSSPFELFCLLLSSLGASPWPPPTGQPTHQLTQENPPSPVAGATLREFVVSRFFPGRNHPPQGETAQLTLMAIARLEESLGRPALLAECDDAFLDRFRDWLAAKVAAPTCKYNAATANKHLRHLRAAINYGYTKRMLANKLGPIDFLPHEPAPVDAWTIEDFWRIEQQAKTLGGSVGPAPAALWWAAWTAVLAKVGSRVGALMAARREDFRGNALLLRAENQKQGKNQRLALSKPACAAIERLLASHDDALIFPWPFDPPPPAGSGRRRNFKTLFAHFQRRLLDPLGLTLPKGVRTRQYRRTVATLVDEYGGSAQKLLGHAHAKTTEGYKDRKRMPICNEALCVPDYTAQRFLFD